MSSFNSFAVRAARLSAFAVLGLLLQVVSASASSTCLTGTDPIVAGDAAQIAAVRDLVDSTCVCSSFDGSDGKRRGDYKDCFEAVIASQVPSGLRRQCRTVVEKMYKRTTCGREAGFHFEPCVYSNDDGVRTCTILPTTKRDGTTPHQKCRDSGMGTAMTCSGFTSCIDAVDTNGDLRIGPDDTPGCDVGTSIRAAVIGRYWTVDTDTAEITTTEADTALDQRFAIETIDDRIVIRALGPGTFLREDGGAIYADAADAASATAWVVFIQTAVAGAATSNEAYILKDGPAGAQVDVIRADAGTGEIRVVSMNVVDALSAAETRMTLIQR